ncbi:hypothetical protein B0H11DRAFT_2203947 [Mycena galericulata]|nr:hypothetical protein B0H11DRAFT_2203947 [Mycena galericulata]
MIYHIVIAVIVLLALMQSFAVIISDARFAVTTEISEILKLMVGVKLSQYRAKTPWKQTDSLITKLIFNTIETGAVTSLVAVADVVLFITLPATNLHHMPAFMLGKLYSNVLLVTLNARESRGTPSNTAASNGGETELQWRRPMQDPESGPQKVHISTVTEVTTDLDRKTYPRGGL